MMRKLSLIALAFALVFSASVAGATPTIAFSSRRDGNNDIYTMSPDGSNLTRLTNNSGEYLYLGQPRWSPDGSQIVFTVNDAGYEIYTMNSDGTNLVNLTNSPGSDYEPAWSPVPEPSTALLFTFGLIGMSSMGRRRKECHLG